MAELFIRCKVKGNYLSTGIDVSASVGAESLPKSVVRCPYCGRTHEWTGRDAFFLSERNQPIPLKGATLKGF